MPEPTAEGESREWSIRLVAGGSAGRSASGLPLGVAVEGAAVEIKNRVSGEVGVFGLAGLSVTGLSPGVEGAMGEGSWVHFETGEPQRVEDFAGPARISGATAGTSSWEVIVFGDDLNWPGGFDMDIKHDGFFETVWNGDGVPISESATSVGFGVAEGFVGLELLWTRVEEPDPGIGVAPSEIVAAGLETVEHHLHGTTADLEHAGAEVAAQQSLPDATDPAYDPDVVRHLDDLAATTRAEAELAASQSLDAASVEVTAAQAAIEVDHGQSRAPATERDPGGEICSDDDPPLHEALVDDIRAGIESVDAGASAALDGPDGPADGAGDEPNGPFAADSESDLGGSFEGEPGWGVIDHDAGPWVGTGSSDRQANDVGESYGVALDPFGLAGSADETPGDYTADSGADASDDESPSP